MEYRSFVSSLFAQLVLDLPVLNEYKKNGILSTLTVSSRSQDHLYVSFEINNRVREDGARYSWSETFEIADYVPVSYNREYNATGENGHFERDSIQARFWYNRLGTTAHQIFSCPA